VKSIKAIVVALAATMAGGSLLAQRPGLAINQSLELRLLGHTNNYYQLESTTNLSGWSPYGDPFPLLAAPGVVFLNPTNVGQFFRARALVYATNCSVATACAEEDNINIPLRGDVLRYTITASHPTYTVTSSDCAANFSNCTNSGGTNYSFTALTAKPFDNGTDYLVVNREATFWRPYGMNVTVNGASLYPNIHYIELGRKMPDAASWPLFLALYCDGNLRLIPFPPDHLPSVCFGSSIIVGPAAPASRPLAEIASIDYRTASRSMLVTYRSGGTATLNVSALDRTNASVTVTVNYPTDQPFCTVRSMYVGQGNCDLDTVGFTDLSGVMYSYPVIQFTGAISSAWSFKRSLYSVHNNSAPDIFISAD
jgi:hypothetical protein